MKIGFDAKRAMQNFTGLGNYSRFVIENMVSQYPEYLYELYCPKPNLDKIKISNGKNIRIVNKPKFRPFWRTFWITNDIKKENIDIYHGLSNELPVGVKRTKVKTVVTIHDLIFLVHPEFYPKIDRKIYNIKAKYACKIADRIIAVSECTKRDIIKYYGTDPSKIDVVYQGCFSIFSEDVSDEKKQEVREKHQLPTQYILSIGSIEDRKNILQIVKALKHVPNIHFVAIGKQREYAEKVKQYAKENGLEDRISLLNNIPLEDIPAILKMSSIFIYPSLYEGFGIPIIEALSAGVPVIGAKGSCLEEAGGSSSVYVDPHNAIEMANEIKRLLDDDKLREQMVIDGLDYVKRFSADKCTENLMNTYSKLF